MLDLGPTTLLDSSGLGALVRAAREVDARKAKMAVVSPPGSEARVVIEMSRTGSVVGLRGNFGQTNYAASKAGMIGFTKSLARELGSRGVRANVVAPGYVHSRLTEVIPDDAKELMLQNTPLGRFGDPLDIARAVRFLCSDEASFITGEVLLVDGGLGM